MINDANPDLIKAEIFSSVGRAVRERGKSKRIVLFEQALSTPLKDLGNEEKREVIALCYFLMSVDAWYHFKDIWDYDGPVSSKLCGWAMQLILEAASKGDVPHGRQQHSESAKRQIVGVSKTRRDNLS